MPVNGAGRRSRSTETFLVAGDVEAFSALLAPKIEGTAAWFAPAWSRQGADLVQVLAADGAQTFLRLAAGQGVVRGPLIQYLHGESILSTDGRSCLTALTSRDRPRDPVSRQARLRLGSRRSACRGPRRIP